MAKTTKKTNRSPFKLNSIQKEILRDALEQDKLNRAMKKGRKDYKKKHPFGNPTRNI